MGFNFIQSKLILSYPRELNFIYLSLLRIFFSFYPEIAQAPQYKCFSRMSYSITIILEYSYLTRAACQLHQLNSAFDQKALANKNAILVFAF